jgi:hypothetical protein
VRSAGISCTCSTFPTLTKGPFAYQEIVVLIKCLRDWLMKWKPPRTPLAMAPRTLSRGVLLPLDIVESGAVVGLEGALKWNCLRQWRYANRCNVLQNYFSQCAWGPFTLDPIYIPFLIGMLFPHGSSCPEYIPSQSPVPCLPPVQFLSLGPPSTIGVFRFKSIASDDQSPRLSPTK